MVVLMAIFGFLEVIAWPLVVGIALIGFRKPLSHFLQELGQRITKVSIFQIVTTDLSLPETSQPKVEQLLPALQELTSGELDNDAVSSLFQKIEGGKALDYFVVDLGSKWLTSRLFIFTVMFRLTLGMRCVVFLETRANVDHRFLGIASPSEIQLALAHQYPWLEVAYSSAQTNAQSLPYPGKLNTIILSFLTSVQTLGGKVTPSELDREWILLKNGLREHANSIDRARLERDLGSALQIDSWFEDSPDLSQVKRTRAILRREGSFIALVDKERVFKKLIDRKAFLEQVAVRIGDALDETNK